MLFSISLNQWSQKCDAKCESYTSSRLPKVDHYRSLGSHEVIIFKLTLDILDLIMKGKKKVLTVLNGSLFSNIVVGGLSFF